MMVIQCHVLVDVKISYVLVLYAHNDLHTRTYQSQLMLLVWWSKTRLFGDLITNTLSAEEG